jgi:hypothetical protein
LVSGRGFLDDARVDGVATNLFEPFVSRERLTRR